MLTKRFASLAAVIVVGGGILLTASGADAMLSMNGMSLNLAGINGVTGNAAASQDFDFNSVSVQGVSWSAECPLPVDRNSTVFC